MQEWQTFLIKKNKTERATIFVFTGHVVSVATSQLSPPSTKAARTLVTEGVGSVAGNCRGRCILEDLYPNESRLHPGHGGEGTAVW